MDTAYESFNYPPWLISVSKSHILPSQCTSKTSCQSGILCDYCIFMTTLDLPHFPEMVFPRNIFRLQHEGGFVLEFNALDALKGVMVGEMPIKVACSDDWKLSRMGTGYTNNTVHPFDWTFTTEYSGTCIGCYRVLSDVEETIDIEKLKVQEEILFFKELILFEDELHDNGIAISVVKFRAMPSGYFLLYRFFLRVDGMIVRVIDTRYYFEAEKKYLLRERSYREAKFHEIQHPNVGVLNDPSEYLDLLPVKFVTTDIIYPGK